MDGEYIPLYHPYIQPSVVHPGRTWNILYPPLTCQPSLTQISNYPEIGNYIKRAEINACHHSNVRPNPVHMGCHKRGGGAHRIPGKN